MRYEYRTGIKKLFEENHKAICVAVLAVLLGIVAFSANSVITGFVTYNDELRGELNDYKSDFITMNQSYNECINNINTCMNDLKTKCSTLQNCENEKIAAVNQTKIMENNLNNCKEQKDAIQKNYTNILKDAVKAICCSVDDSINGAVKNWEIRDSKLVCTGNYTVNCTSGETNY